MSALPNLLSRRGARNFTSTSIRVEDKKNACVIHPKDYCQAVKENIKTFKKKELTSGVVRAESKSRAYVSTLLYIDDPIGEVEDLYNEYEFSYHQHYGMNKALIDDIRAKNQYPYAIADMVDYLYVSKNERAKYDSQRDKLKEQYKTLVNLMKEDMTASSVEFYMIENEYYEELI